MNDIEAISRDVAKLSSDLESTLDEHLEIYGEMLAHIFFGDVTRWIENQFATSPDSVDLCKVLDLLEEDYKCGNDVVRELLVVSFLENLDHDSMVFNLLGPNLVQAAEEFGLMGGT
jgi:hypothetical protein